MFFRTRSFLFRKQLLFYLSVAAKGIFTRSGLGLLLALVSVLLGGVTLAPMLGFDLSTTPTVAAFLALAILFTVAHMQFSSPSDLAELMVEGEEDRRILSVIAAEIFLLLSESTYVAESAAKALECRHDRERRKGGDTIEKCLEPRCILALKSSSNKRRLERVRLAIKMMLEQQARKVFLIDELLARAERNLKIDEYLLGDEFLHFNTAIFRDRSEELDRRYNMIFNWLRSESYCANDCGECDHCRKNRGQSDSIGELSQSIRSIARESQRRKKRAETVLRHYYVNGYLLETISARSFTLATQSYARCLAIMEQRSLRWNRGQGVLDKMHGGLEYLFLSQAAYPGVWPHRGLKQVLTQLADQGRDRRRLQRIVDLLSLFDRPKVIAGQAKYRPGERERKIREALADWYSRYQESLSPDGHLFGNLSQVVRAGLLRWRTTIGERLKVFLREQLESFDRVYLVPEGGSTTVQQAVEGCEDLPNLQIVAIWDRSDEGVSENAARTIHALKEKRLGARSSQLRLGTFRQILKKESDCVVLVASAEAMGDRGDNSFIALSSRQASHIENIKKTCADAGAEFHFVVTASEFKYASKLFELDARGARIDRGIDLRIYGAKSATQVNEKKIGKPTIITESRVQTPSDWPAIGKLSAADPSPRALTSDSQLENFTRESNGDGATPPPRSKTTSLPPAPAPIRRTGSAVSTLRPIPRTGTARFAHHLHQSEPDDQGQDEP